VGIDRSDPLSLHEQVAAEIRRAIAEGEAGPGDRLPLARDLAAVLGVNRNTVLRALHLLRDEGLLEFRRGHGIKVTGTSEKSDLLRAGTRPGRDRTPKRLSKERSDRDDRGGQGMTTQLPSRERAATDRESPDVLFDEARRRRRRRWMLAALSWSLRSSPEH